MKLAVITLHRVYNYGSALQAYATQKLFENMGYEVAVIDYITAQRTKKRIFRAPSAVGELHGIQGLIYKILKVFSIILKEATFGTFVRKNLNLTKKYITEEDLRKDPPIADVYITGSDQTWNSNYNEGVDGGFFLTFAPKNARKISFVSSFGKNTLDKNEIELTKKYISDYYALSVREDSGKTILSELGRDDAIQLIDPTLQINKEEWKKLASKRLVREPYLILMLLYSEDNNATEYARRIADEKHLKLVKISWEMIRPRKVDKLFTHRSPGDFLSLFYYADYVVTNSFHGLAFAINFMKQFIIIPRSEYNTRIESLLRITGLQNRLVSSKDQFDEYRKAIDYEAVNEKLDHERTRAKSFLRKSLEGMNN